MIFEQPDFLIETLGWTLLHSLWQGAVISFLFFIALRLMRTASANARYLAAGAALCLFGILPAITFVRLAKDLSVSNKIERAKTEDQLGRGANIFQEKPARNLFENTASANGNELPTADVPNIIQNNLIWLESQTSRALPLMVWLWLFGAALTALRLSGGFRQISQLKNQGVAAASGEWEKRFARLTLELKINPAVKLLESALVSTPLTVGWLKPLVIIPTSAFLQLAPDELEMIIKHELVHIRRYDYLINIIQSFVEAAFFYHPGVWWISSVMRREREFACDEAVSQLSEDKFAYARALANLEQFRFVANNDQSRLTLAASGGKLTERIRRIIEPKSNFSVSRPLSLALGLAVLLVAAMMLGASAKFFDSSVIAQNQAKSKKMAIGFVSIMPLDRTADPLKDADATARLLIEKLKAHQIPAIGFLRGSSISDGENLFPDRAAIVRMWRDAGLEIGIGNFRHVGFYDTPYDEYVAGVEKNEAVAKKILGEKNLRLKYFSYPYLNTGRNADERNRFEAWLKTQNVTPVKYTVDNQEWMYSYAYDMAQKDNDAEKMKRIRVEFLDYMTKMLDHFENYSQEMFGRDINQTMVLTPSRLVASSADDLFGMIEKHGYKFVSMDEAQADEAYNTPESFYGKAGISWFERWQMAKGGKLLDEPNVDADIWKLWKASDQGK